MEDTISTVHLLARIEALERRVREPKPDLIPSRSTDLKELFTALAKAQAEMQCAGRKSENPYFKSSYADLAEVVRVSRPALAKNGLSVIQQVLPNEDGQNILHTILAHSSGQWIESRMRILPSKPDVQALQSYITYIRRSAYSALIGVTVTDEDDDAEVAVHQDRETFAKGVALSTQYNPSKNTYETVTKEQLDELNLELKGWPDIAEQVLNGWQIQNLADMKKEHWSASLQKIRKIKLMREGLK